MLSAGVRHFEILAPYVERYFVELPAVATRRSAMVLERLADAAYPRFAVREATRSAARTA